MQQPTCKDLRIRNVHDAQVVLHAVMLGQLPMVRRRLDDDERLALKPGHVYVWEERSTNPLEANTLDSIQRFTDGRSWGPSKARDDFLLYYEKEGTSRSSIMQRNNGLEAMRLIKQTYSAYVDGPTNSRKWHLNAYYTQETFDRMHSVDEIPALQAIRVPEGRYICARSSAMRRNARVAANRHSSTEDTDTPDTYSHSLPPHSSAHHTATYAFPEHPPTAHHRAQYVSHQFLPASRNLAPLEYLENITPRVRNPVDDQQLRSFRYVTAL